LIACDLLLSHRVERKLKSSHVKEIVGQIDVTNPTRRDNKERTTAIPPSVAAARAAKKAASAAAAEEDDDDSMDTKDAKPVSLSAPKRRTEKDIELENGGPGVYNVDLKKNYLYVWVGGVRV
jgi:nucleolar GTP-binding protein